MGISERFSGSEPGMTWKRGLAGLVLLAAAAVALGFFWPFGRNGQILSLPGVVEIQEVRLGSKIGGRVRSVEVVEGSIAEKDQVLATFDAPELEAQRNQAEAHLQSAQADLEKANNGPRVQEKEAAKMAMEAARAKWNRLKAGPRKEEIEEARSEVETAQADVQLAEDTLKRVQRLFNSQASFAEEMERAGSNRARLRGRLNKAKASLDLLLAGYRPEDVAEAEAQYKQARANYELLLAGTRSEDIQGAEARVAEYAGKLREIKANLDETTVRAPERVVVEVLAVRRGDLVVPNQTIMRVLRADDLWVKAYVPETEMARVKLGVEVEVSVDSYPGRRFQGVIRQISSASEFTPRNVQSADERRHQVFGIKVHVPDPDGIFKSGMAAQVYIPLRG
jgi:multidrug resistance efflux pump